MEVSVTEIELENGTSIGLHLRTFGGETVPVYEEHTSRLERGISLDTWSNMPVEERAIVIAARRVQKAIDSLYADAEIKASKARMKKKAPRSG